MARAIRADTASAWRDRARYDRLLGFDRATWAWECLRRAIGHNLRMPCRASWTLLRARPPLCVLTIRRCNFVCNRVLPLAALGSLDDFTGHVFWCAERQAPTLTVDARSALPGEVDLFDLHALDHPIVVLRHPVDGEHVLIADGPRCIRIAVRSGTLLAGPVHLDFHVTGDAQVETNILMLRRLVSVCRLGRFPRTLFPPERRARRWALALQAWDGRPAGASPREIAPALHGAATVRDEWLGTSDYLRTHIKRLLRTADTLIGGGWRHLLR